MKGYLITTGSVFGLLTIVHVWRMVVEPSSRDPFIVLVTVLSTAFAVWAWRLLMISRRSL